MDNNFGVDDFSASLDALSYAIRNKIMMAATKAGAQIIQDEASARAPRLDPSKSSLKRWSGELAAMMTNRIVSSDSETYTVRIGPDKTTFWGRFSEEGTIHESPEAFLLPALDEKYDEALSAIGNAIWSGISSNQ